MAIPPIMHRSDLATDFHEYALGAEPSTVDWTERSGGHGWTVTADTAAISGRTVIAGTQGGDVVALTWDRLPDVSSSEFDVLILLSGDSASVAISMMGSVNCDSSGDNGNNFGFRALESPTSVVETADYASGTYVSGTQVGVTATINTRYWFRYHKPTSGSRTGKFWAYGAAEPGSWDVTRTAGTSQAYLGIMAVSVPQFRVDWFSVAIGAGKVAPFPQG